MRASVLCHVLIILWGLTSAATTTLFTPRQSRAIPMTRHSCWSGILLDRKLTYHLKTLSLQRREIIPCRPSTICIGTTEQLRESTKGSSTRLKSRDRISLTLQCKCRPSLIFIRHSYQKICCKPFAASTGSVGICFLQDPKGC